MGLLNIFSRLIEVDAYQKELSQLAKSIATLNGQADVLRQRRSSSRNHFLSLLIPIYLLWLVYRLRWSKSSRFSLNDIIIAVGCPITIAAIVYLMNLLFLMLISNRSRKLAAQKRRQRQKIDELKEKTNYNAANDLISRYDSLNAAKSDAEKPTKPQQKSQSMPKPMPKPQSIPQPKNIPANLAANIPAPPQSTQLGAPPAPQNRNRTFQDRLLDFIIGSDNNESIESRFALICSACYAHNGLAPPGCKDPASVPFVCLRCSTLNNLVPSEVSQIPQQVLQESPQEAPQEAPRDIPQKTPSPNLTASSNSSEKSPAL